MPPAGSDPAPEDLASLVRAAGRGEQEAWRELVGLFSRRVFALVRSRCGRDDLAEEVTQSVFVTVAEQLASRAYSERGRFESWLFLIAMNRLRDEVRREKRQAALRAPEDLGGLADSASAHPRAEAGELASLRNAIQQLGEADRTIIELRHHAGLSFKQISEALSEPVGTLLARHHRALAKLRAMMGSGSEAGAASPAAESLPTDRRRATS